MAIALPDNASASDPPSTEAKASVRARKQKRMARGPRRYKAHHIAQVQRQYVTLREMIEKEMDLSSELEQTVGAIFDRYSRAMRGDAPRPGLYRNRDETLEGRGDTAKAELLQQFRRRYGGPQQPPRPAVPGGRAAKGKGPMPSLFDGHNAIIEDLIQEFDGEERRKMRRLTTRWQAFQPRIGLHDAHLGRLLRSLKDPLLDITQEQRTEFRRKIVMRSRTMRKDRFDPAVTSAAADEMSAEIAKELTAEQRDHFFATWKALEKEAAIVKRLMDEAKNKQEKERKGARQGD